MVIVSVPGEWKANMFQAEELVLRPWADDSEGMMNSQSETVFRAVSHLRNQLDRVREDIVGASAVAELNRAMRVFTELVESDPGGAEWALLDVARRIARAAALMHDSAEDNGQRQNWKAVSAATKKTVLALARDPALARNNPLQQKGKSRQPSH